jgi:hypothetical protein
MPCKSYFSDYQNLSTHYIYKYNDYYLIKKLRARKLSLQN